MPCRYRCRVAWFKKYREPLIFRGVKYSRNFINSCSRNETFINKKFKLMVLTWFRRLNAVKVDRKNISLSEQTGFANIFAMRAHKQE